MFKVWALLLTIVSLQAGAAMPADTTSVTDWLKEARLGAFMHFLPADESDQVRRTVRCGGPGRAAAVDGHKILGLHPGTAFGLVRCSQFGL